MKPAVIERFSHIVDAIQRKWGTDYLEIYLNSLMLVDSTRQHRQGFPAEVQMEFLFLLDLHRRVFGKVTPAEIPKPHSSGVFEFRFEEKDEDVWGPNYGR